MAANEYRMRARWRLGQMLTAMFSHKPGRPKKGTARALFRAAIKRLKLERPRAVEMMRIGHLPKIELGKGLRGVLKTPRKALTTSGRVLKTPPEVKTNSNWKTLKNP